MVDRNEKAPTDLDAHSRPMKLILFAPNVGSGGGLVLLRELLGANWPVQNVTAILDVRGRPQLDAIAAKLQIRWANSGLLGRLRAEALLSRWARPDDIVLCFHNLPPLFPTQGRVICFVQNAHVVGLVPVSALNLRIGLRTLAERLVARLLGHRIRRYVVQTPTMASALRAKLGAKLRPVDIVPFASKELVQTQARPRPRATPDLREPTKLWDFVYVSDGSPHKNHRRLFAAWQMLADRGEHPSLAVTLHPVRDVAIVEEVRELAAAGLRIVDLGQMPHVEVMTAYNHARALIFPSLAESFGLPLLEAQSAGLPILASELDYVRDVCEPVATFDPHSPRSIARAVSRFAGQRDDRVALLTADGFAVKLCPGKSQTDGWQFME